MEKFRNNEINYKKVTKIKSRENHLQPRCQLDDEYLPCTKAQLIRCDKKNT